MSLLAVAGWLLAAAGMGAAATLRVRLLRHLESVSRACHELRGPLTALRLGLELGARTAAAPPSRVRAIELELGRARLALEDLSDLRATRRPAGRVWAVPEPVDMAELVADCVEPWRGLAPGDGIRLLSPESGPELVVAGERLRLAQALGNLIANAVEHGGAAITLKLRAEPGLVRIEVLDDGPGLPTCVEELVRRRRRRARFRGGSARGHGLAIVQAIAAAHGGRLSAAPSDRGATLVLELPMASRALADVSRRARG